MRKLTPRGRLVLIAAVGVLVGVAGKYLVDPSPRARTSSKTLQWEALEGEEGSDLNRVQTPNGWIVENVDGYMVVLDDPEHEWLKDE